MLPLCAPPLRRLPAFTAQMIIPRSLHTDPPRDTVPPRQPVEQRRDRGSAGGYGGEGTMEGRETVQHERLHEEHAESEAARRLKPEGEGPGGGLEMDRQRESGGGWD